MICRRRVAFAALTEDPKSLEAVVRITRDVGRLRVRVAVALLPSEEVPAEASTSIGEVL